MSKKIQILKNNLKKIKFVLIASIFFLIISTLIFNFNYSSITINSIVRVEVVESNFTTRNISKNNKINLKLVADTSNLQEIAKNYNLSELKWNNNSIDFLVKRELKKYPEFKSEIFLEESSKLNEEIALSILKKLNAQLKVLSKEILENKYITLSNEKQIIDKIQILEQSSNELDKIKLMILKLDFYKVSYSSPGEIKGFKNVQNMDDFKKLYNIGYVISRINEEIYDDKKIISYFDLFLLILSLLIIYISLKLFLNLYLDKLKN